MVSQQSKVSDQFPVVSIRILLVDDDRTCLMILDMMLRICHYKVTKCQQAEVALTKRMDNNDNNSERIQQLIYVAAICAFCSVRNCVGAIDGSYIPAMVDVEDQPRYCTRKGRIAQNVMAAIGFDMKFTYVLAGWEGSARDAKVLRSAIREVPAKLVVVILVLYARQHKGNFAPSMRLLVIVNAVGMSKKSSESNGNYVAWTTEMDRVCIDTLVDEHGKGNKGDNGWKSQPYQSVLKAMEENLSKTLHKDNIRSRLRYWRKFYHTINNLINQSVFGWNDAKKMIEADDYTWTEYLKDNEKKKRKKSRRESVTDDIQVFSESFKCIADAIEGVSSVIDMDKLFTELIKIPDFDKELVIEAAEYLSSDKKKVDMFFAMNEDYRKTWDVSPELSGYVNPADIEYFKEASSKSWTGDFVVFDFNTVDEGQALKSVTHGACDYLTKPIRIESIKKIWQHVVQKRRNELKDLEKSGNVEDGDLHQKPFEVEYTSSANEGNSRH
ncbi:hypothetical protein HHK36_019507 [Tetracentron sinense]|uniref:Myb/SANT-like domain-containing protein n=1 Tax=Tetracentron sinense TaxID=13715 RepID=A0A834YTW4_TETSI|nr:hypothetical protein HHK36_019507 [Tetracentron sinense]